MRIGTFAAIVTAVGITLVAGRQALDAQAARSYTWYAQLASVDPAAKSVTVKVQIRDGVTRYVGTYKVGDKLMLTWTPIKGESDTVIYAPKYEVMKGIDEGYLLPAEFVSADVADHSLTVKIAATPAVLQSLQSVQAGGWIKVVAPMRQPAETAALVSAMASAKPDLKPPPPPAPAAAAEAPGRGRGRGQGAPAAGAAAATPIAGTWTVNAEIAGNAIGSECVFALQGAALSGTCSAQGATSPVTGEVAGNNVKFTYTVSLGGMALEFAFDGTVDAAAKAMKGNFVVFGMTGDFTATKK